MLRLEAVSVGSDKVDDTDGEFVRSVVHWPTSTERVVDACGVESQGLNESAIVGDDPDVGSATRSRTFRFLWVVPTGMWCSLPR